MLSPHINMNETINGNCLHLCINEYIQGIRSHIPVWEKFLEISLQSLLDGQFKFNL